jgi:hypothetical protein
MPQSSLSRLAGKGQQPALAGRPSLIGQNPPYALPECSPDSRHSKVGAARENAGQSPTEHPWRIRCGAGVLGSIRRSI